MTLTEARAAEREGRDEDAADLYERALAGGRQRDAMLDLAVLYWQATDYGYLAAKKLRAEFVSRAGKRFPELLREAASAFPDSTEVEFWCRYIEWTDFGGPAPTNACAELLARDPTTLAPAMHLFSVSQGRQCRSEASALLRASEGLGTARARYVVSVIDGVLRRQARP